MIYLAYDGSINGDWVAWYAMNLARRTPERQLRVLYIDTGEIDLEEVRAKCAELERACADARVEMALDILESSGPGVNAIFGDIVTNVPAREDTLLVCGARLKPGAVGYLSGTVSEKLLCDKNFKVMAVRVAQPGLLGAPRRFLVPVAGDLEGFLLGADILKRFGSDVARIDLLRVMMIKRQLFRRLLNGQAEQLREKGWTSLVGLEAELAELTGVDEWKIDANVAVSDDWAHEVIIAANRHKSQLILMEASRKNLSATFTYGNPIEVVLRDAPCDVAIYRGV